MKVLYLGTPGCSARCLKAILEAGIDVVGVVTQPDRPSGRDRSLQPPPVKTLALEKGIRVFQPEKASSPEAIRELAELEPDVTVVFAFGEFLSDDFITIPKISTVNLHLSLLPKYRGAAPVQWAIINGEKETGATTFHIVRELDAGDIIYQEKIEIRDDDTSESLTERLAELGSKLVVKTVGDLYRGVAPRVSQNHSLATRARKLKKEDGAIDWSFSAEKIRNLVRGLNPWPCAYSFWDSKTGKRMIKFLDVECASSESTHTKGEVFSEKGGMFVSTGSGAIRVISLQIEGKKKMSGIEFLNGHREILGAVL